VKRTVSLQFLDLFQTIGRTPWTGDQPVARPLPTHRTTQTQKNTHTHQTSIPEVGFEFMITASEQAKTVHASDYSATVTSVTFLLYIKVKLSLYRLYATAKLKKDKVKMFCDTVSSQLRQLHKQTSDMTECIYFYQSPVSS
jgi:hypothetical protein